MEYKKILLYILILNFLLLSLNPIIFAENDIRLINNQKTNNILDINLHEQIINYNEIEYWALLIGINDYPGTADLPYSINEILSFEKTLINGGNWNETNIHILTNDQANKSTIFDEINWLNQNADENDISIIYYAGHGSANNTNEFLVVYDGVISDEELNQKLEEVKGQIVVIIDSCFSGGFIKELGRKDRIILTACRKNERTYQVKNLSSGIFGYFLNISFERFTKSVEKTFILTWMFCVYYSNKLSQEFNDDYTIHPRIFDGTLGKVKIIENNSYMTILFHEILNKSNEKNIFNIWKM